MQLKSNLTKWLESLAEVVGGVESLAAAGFLGIKKHFKLLKWENMSFSH